ncbi:hypothetical protein DID77_03185 [Candidatus Marinamargulisbacteria bacterium SCGC AG-439-L15]|nr:hypothetical protein DID77_03185 [Candidatus Marinamargulisbacteria bacterium SCGC AG-439-L15]
MKNTVLVEKYIQSFVSCFKKEETVQRLEELQAIINHILNDHNVWTMIQSPLCSKKDNEQLLLKIINNYSSEQKIKNFFTVLNVKNRLGLCPELQNTIKRAIQVEKNEIDALVYTANPAEKDTQSAILSLLQKQVPQTVQATFKEDATLIGGFKAILEGKLVEGSIKNAFSELEETIIKRN